MPRPDVTCYPQPGKRKAIEVCEAFARGCSGDVVHSVPDRLRSGAAMFYGVRPAWFHLWEQAKAEGRDWFYADNAFLGDRHFRIARNAVQAAPLPPDYDRLDQLNIEIKPWRRTGRHVLVCLQTDEFMATVARAGMPEILTDRPVKVRRKGSPVPLADDLRDCWCVVTWSSAAGIEAVLAGVPAIALGESVIPYGDIEDPPKFDRREWAARLAANQWTLEEMADGTAWINLTRELNGSDRPEGKRLVRR